MNCTRTPPCSQKPQDPWPEDRDAPTPVPPASPRGEVEQWRMCDLALPLGMTESLYARVTREACYASDPTEPPRFEVEFRDAALRVTNVRLLPHRRVLESWPVVLPARPVVAWHSGEDVRRAEAMMHTWRSSREGSGYAACDLEEVTQPVTGGPHLRVVLVDREGRRTRAAWTVDEVLAEFPECGKLLVGLPEVARWERLRAPTGTEVVVQPADRRGEHRVQILYRGSLSFEAALDLEQTKLSPAAIRQLFPERVERPSEEYRGPLVGRLAHSPLLAAVLVACAGEGSR